MGSNKQEEIQRRVGVGASICWPVEKGVSGREDRESMASPAKCKVGRGEYGQQVGYDGGRGREEGRKDGFAEIKKSLTRSSEMIMQTMSSSWGYHRVRFVF